MTAITHSAAMTGRHLRILARQPWFIAASLGQPLLWLLFFSALLTPVVEVPGFSAASYLDFFTPGMVIMGALFASGWSGLGIIDDLDRGVIDRFLVTPVARVSLMSGRILQGAVTTTIQSVVILGLAAAAGARYPGGVAGIAILLVAAVLLSAVFTALSNGYAMLVRKEQSLIAVVQAVTLPLAFLSSTFMQNDLAPAWIRAASRFNPVHWAVEVGRGAVAGTATTGEIAAGLGLLAALTVLASAVATRSFRSYQKGR